MKKILLIGKTGFVGRNLYEYLSNNYDIVAPSSKELDALDWESVKSLFRTQSFDIVINAIDRRIDRQVTNSESLYLHERLRTFMNLAHCSDLYGKMLYFGTGAEYARELPIVSITEDEFDRKIPNDTYGFLMNTLSKYTLNSKNIYNFRLFGIFGKYEDYTARFISNSICKALFDYPITIRQNAVFDYLYIDDLCRMVEFFIHNDMKYHCYNATSGMKYELLQLANMINKAVGKELPILVAKDGLNKEYTGSNKKILEEIPITIGDMQENIIDLLGYYQDNITKLRKENLLYNCI